GTDSFGKRMRYCKSDASSKLGNHLRKAPSAPDPLLVVFAPSDSDQGCVRQESDVDRPMATHKIRWHWRSRVAHRNLAFSGFIGLVLTDEADLVLTDGSTYIRDFACAQAELRKRTQPPC